jgi:hypothetical protein
LQRPLSTDRLYMLKRSYKIVALIVVSCVWGSPLMACMIPGDALTEAERECCQQMGDSCGSATMPDSHSCCKTTVQQIDPYLAKSRLDSSFTFSAIIPVAQPDFLAPVSAVPMQAAHAHSPPVSPPETISILRI